MEPQGTSRRAVGRLAITGFGLLLVGGAAAADLVPGPLAGAGLVVLGAFLASTVRSVRIGELRAPSGDARYRDLFEHAVEGMFVTTAEGHYIAVNSALARIYGFESAEALVADVRDIASQLYVDPGRRDAFREAIARDGTVSDFESRVRRRDGQVIWISETAREVRNERGYVVRYEGIVVDVTDRKRTEAELVRAKEEAESAGRLKSQFLATMSHELRTPMNAVLGSTTLLLETELTEEQRESVETTRDAAEGLLTLLGDILHFSQLEAERVPIDDAPFAVHDVVQAVIRSLAPSAAARGLALEAAVSAEIPAALRGDPERAAQVLRRLAENAVKFTELGRVELRASLVQRREDGGAIVRLCVSDTGVGIAPEFQRKLYDAFSQEDGSMARRFGGMGLGLAIAHRLVRAMGGEIGVDSAPGHGSTFWFTVPLGAGKDATSLVASPGGTAADRAPAAPGATDAPRRARPRVLLAEDNAVNQRVAQRMLEKLGVDLDVAANGREASRAVARGGYDLVLMDCQMPEMDGFEAARAIRAREADEAARGLPVRRIPIVAVTANVMDGDRERCLEAGMDAYLPKPVRVEALRKTLRRWLPESREDA